MGRKLFIQQFTSSSISMKKVSVVLALLISVLIAGCTTSGPNKEANNSYRDCDDCPQSINIDSGSFLMGTATANRLTDAETPLIADYVVEQNGWVGNGANSQ